MAGTFSKSARPTRPGAYFRFKGLTPARKAVGSSGVVATSFESDWGPENVVKPLDSFAAYAATYGSSATTDGYYAAYNVFVGEGIDGSGGAAQMLAYRIVNSAAVKASKVLPGASSATITLTAKYKGTLGNSLTVTVGPKAGSATLSTLVIAGTPFQREEYTYANADITALGALINASSKLVTAGTITSTGALTTVASPAAFTGGTNGTQSAGDFTASLTAFSAQRFGLYSAYKNADATSVAAIRQWAIDSNNAGKRFMAIIGGIDADDMAAAVTRTGTLANENIINLGYGTFNDAVLGKTFNTSELGPRVAGILARCGEAQSLTFARLGGLTIVTSPTDAEILTALDNGVTTFGGDSHPTAPVRIERGLTTYATLTDTEKPVKIFSNPKFMRTMQTFEREFTEDMEQNMIGKVTVGPDGRSAVKAVAERALAAREAAGIIQPGWTVEIDLDPLPASDDDFVSLVYGIILGRSLEQVFSTVTVA